MNITVLTLREKEREREREIQRAKKIHDADSSIYNGTEMKLPKFDMVALGGKILIWGTPYLTLNVPIAETN